MEAKWDREETRRLEKIAESCKSVAFCGALIPLWENAAVGRHVSGCLDTCPLGRSPAGGDAQREEGSVVNEQLWGAIVALVQALRQFSPADYDNRCGLDPVQDRDRIDELYQGRRYLAPDYLAVLLAGGVHNAQQEPGAAPVLWRTIMTAIGACAYGPEGDMPPPDLLNELDRKAAWDVGGAQCGLERLVVYGAMLPNGREEWNHRWATAFETLRYVVEVAYHGRELPGAERHAMGDVAWNVRWIAGYVLHQEKHQVQDTVETHTPVYCAIIRGHLALGCSCHARWQKMRLESENKAKEHCKGHKLDGWDRRLPLSDFVWDAAIKRNLPAINDFRRGILAKLVSEEDNLEVYPVLVCVQKECTGEIGLDNRCSNVNCQSIGGETEYRLARDGTRRQWFGRRCTKCGRLFLGRPDRCPVCGAKVSQRDTEIWIPIVDEPGADLPSGEDATQDETLSELRDSLSQLRDRLRPLEGQEIDRMLKLTAPRGDQLRAMALHLIEESWNLEDAAREAGIPGNKVDLACKRLRSLVRIFRIGDAGNGESDTEED